MESGVGGASSKVLSFIECTIFSVVSVASREKGGEEHLESKPVELLFENI